MMSDKYEKDLASPKLFALHHLCSLALFMLGLGLLVFVIVTRQMLEGDTLRFDRWLLLAHWLQERGHRGGINAS